MFTIDTTTEFGARVERQLAVGQVVWLTTVGRSGAPAPNPVWFGWTGSELLVASQRGKAKLRNLEANPSVAVNFNSTPAGGDVTVIAGTAVIDGAGFSAEERAAYDRKYAEGMATLSLTPDQFHAEYSELIRITPVKLRGF
jgi:PPOX class probable F420-dependent enzyme